MRIVRQLIAGVEGWNENPAVRTVRYAALLGIVAGLDALSSHLTSVGLPDPAVSVPLVTVALAGAEKWARNKATQAPPPAPKPPSAP